MKLAECLIGVCTVHTKRVVGMPMRVDGLLRLLCRSASAGCIRELEYWCISGMVYL